MYNNNNNNQSINQSPNDHIDTTVQQSVQSTVHHQSDQCYITIQSTKNLKLFKIHTHTSSKNLPPFHKHH